MQKKIQVIAFLLGCIMVIGFAIQAGRHHENCRECKLSFSQSENESAKFAEVCK